MKRLIGMVMLASVFGGKVVHGQTLRLSEALARAEKEYLGLQATQSQVSAERALIPAAKDLPKTTMTGVFGGINSHNETDYSLNISQTFALPAYYRAGQQYYRARTEQAESILNLQKYELRQAVKQVYYDIIYLNEYHKLLQSEDSLFEKYYHAVTVHYQAGGTSLLEKVNAENHVREIESLLMGLEYDRKIAHRRLAFLLNSPDSVTVSPAESVRRSLPPAPNDSILTENHPSLQPIKQQISVAEQSLQWETKKRLPEFNLGYMQQSFYQFYGVGHMLQIGMNIPFYRKAYQARIESAQEQLLATRKNYDFRYQEAQFNRQSAWMQVQRYQSLLAYYDTVALKQASLLLESGIKNYQAGEISYLEYLMVKHEALAIRRNYLETLRNYNRSVIEWEGWLEGR